MSSESPSTSQFLALPGVVQRFKSLTTHEYHLMRKQGEYANLPATLWQRSFYDRVLRGDRELEMAREYIVNNPLAWELELNQHPEHPFK